MQNRKLAHQSNNALEMALRFFVLTLLFIGMLASIGFSLVGFTLGPQSMGFWLLFLAALCGLLFVLMLFKTIKALKKSRPAS